MILTCIFHIALYQLVLSVNADEFQLQIGNHSTYVVTRSQELFTAVSFNNKLVLTGHHGLSLKDLQSCVKQDAWSATCNWASGRLNIREMKLGEKLTCTRFVWSAKDYSDVLKDCYDLGDAQWYGGGETYTQSWPMQDDSRSESPYVLNDVLQNPEHFYGGVLERLWISSKGITIRVGADVPLFVSLNQSNDNQICFISKNHYPYLNRDRTPPKLWYSVCAADDLLTAYKDAVNTYFQKPVAPPDTQMLTDPFWNTWAKYHNNISASTVLDFARTINKYEFPKSLFQIDDKWEGCYGQLEFDKESFPDPKGLISEMNSLGFRVNVWVHPFINEECPAFKEGEANGYFIRSFDKTVAMAKWWNGDRAGIIDVTNPRAADWWKKRLQRVQKEYGVNAFKFDAGETNWLPQNVTLYTGLDALFPNSYATEYGRFTEQFGKTVEVRQRYMNQASSLFVRLLDRESRWNNSLGLQTIIPAVLVFGILGYPYILPDMIGGNAYGEFPSKELYIRWIEANALLPVMQFSVSPWQYDDEVVAIAKKMIQLHKDHSQLFIKLAEEATSTGWPIIRPLWWVAPTDSTAQVIGSQFLIGNTVLVAPVLEKGATSRDIYLPQGTWHDNLRDTMYTGPMWLHDYGVQLNELAYFTASSL